MIEINRVSNLGRIVDKIGSELPKPFAILIYGMDGELKTQVKQQLTSGIHNLTRTDYSVATDTTKLREIFRRKENLLLEIPPTDRHQISTIVHRLKSAKAKCVVGIYVKPLAERFAGNIDALKVWHQMDINPPRAREFDYFVPFTEDAIRVLWCGCNNIECLSAFKIARNMNDISITDCICPGSQSLHQNFEGKYATDACIRQYPLNCDPYMLAKLIQDVDIIVGGTDIGDFLNNITLATYAGKPFMNRCKQVPWHLECFIDDAIPQIPVYYDPDYDFDTAHNPAAGQRILEIAQFMTKQPLRDTPYTFSDFLKP